MAETTIGSDAVVVYGLSTDTKTVKPIGSLFIEMDTGLEFSSNGAGWFSRQQIVLNSNDETAGSMVAEISNWQPEAETWRYDHGVTANANAALLTTSDVSIFCPFDTLTLTKSAAVETATATLRLRPNSDGILVISGLTGETIALTGNIAGIDTGNLFVRTAAAGGLLVASALGNGTYQLVF